MKTLYTSFIALLIGVTAAVADDIHPVCDAIGDFTVTAFEARAEGLPVGDAMELARNSGDAELDDALAAVVEVAYALEISDNEAEAESQLVDFTAELILACQEGFDEA